MYSFQMEPSKWLKDTFPKAYESAQKALETQRRQPPTSNEERIEMNRRLNELSRQNRDKKIDDQTAR